MCIDGQRLFEGKAEGCQGSLSAVERLDDDDVT